MKFKMYHVIVIVLIIVTVGGFLYIRGLKELEKPVVLYESDEIKKTIDYPKSTDIKGETVESGMTIKPSRTIDKLFNTMEELEEYCYASWDEEWSDSTNFYVDELTLGDAVWCGLYSEYKASSTYKSEDDKYSLNNLDNLVLDGCWCEGIEGDGIGETIEINTFDTCEKVYKAEYDSLDRFVAVRDCFSVEEVTEYLLEDHNKELEYYPDEVKITEDSLQNYYHNRLDQIVIINGYASDDTLWKNNNRVKKLKLTIDDKIECYLELEDTKDLQLFDINYANDTITKPINLKFEIVEVYEGEKYDDTCLTSLYLTGGSNVRWGGR